MIKKKTDFCNLAIEYGFQILIEKPTRVTKDTESCIDNFLINFESENLFSDVNEKINLSDHYAIELNVPSINKEPNSFEPNYYRPYTHKNIQRAKLLINDVKLRTPTEATEVDAEFQSFAKKIEIIHNESCPPRVVKPNSKQWITPGLKNSAKFKNTLRSWIKLNHSTVLMKFYTSYVKIYRKILRKAKQLHTENIISKSSNPNKTTWRLVNNMTGKVKDSTISEIIIDGLPVTKNEILAEKFNAFFTTKVPKLLKETYKNNQKIANTLNFPKYKKNFSFHRVSESYISSTIKELKNSKSSTHSIVPMHFLKQVDEEISKPLLPIFDAIINTSYYPKELKKSTVIPLHKKGPKNLMSNYRPIALNDPINKIFEKILHKQITTFFTKNKLFHDNHHGFLPGKSTHTAIQNKLKILHNNFNNKLISVVLYCDLSAAFDTVNHDLLLKKLENYGFDAAALKLLASYLKDRLQAVLLKFPNNKTVRSLYEILVVGVPQGSILRPLLFLIYINDLTNIIPKELCSVIMFADDVSLIISGTNIHDIFVKLNTVFKLISEWFFNNFMILNLEKTSLMLFNCSKNIFNEKIISLNNKDLNIVDSQKFLGIFFEPDLKFQFQLSCLIKKLHSVTFKFKILRNTLSTKSLINLYHALFVSLIRYSIMYFNSMTQIDSLFKAQKKVLRTIFHLPRNTTCKNLFTDKKLLTVPSLYIYEVCLYVFTHLADFKTQSDVHKYNTRNKENLSSVHNESTFTQKSYINKGIHFFNKLPNEIKKLETISSFKHHLCAYLIPRCIYDIDEY